MNNERLFSILEYLIDHCEMLMEERTNTEGMEYCLILRNELFSGKSHNPLTFKVINSEPREEPTVVWSRENKSFGS